MKHKISFTLYSLLSITLFGGFLYAQDLMWRVKCSTKGCTYSTEWNGDRKVVDQWSANHIRNNPGHNGFVEGKGKK